MPLPKWAVYTLSALGVAVVGTVGYEEYKKYQAKKGATSPASPGGVLSPAMVNWIPGCTPPANFTPPSDWIPGQVPATGLVGWVLPVGWKVGNSLPVGTACPPGWTAVPITTTGPGYTEESYTAKNGVLWTLRHVFATSGSPEKWIGYRPSLKETADSIPVAAATRDNLVSAIEYTFGATSSESYTDTKGVVWTLQHNMASGSTPEQWVAFRPALGEVAEHPSAVQPTRDGLVKLIEATYGSGASDTATALPSGGPTASTIGVSGVGASMVERADGRRIAMGPGGRPRYIAPRPNQPPPMRGRAKIG